MTTTIVIPADGMEHGFFVPPGVAQITFDMCGGSGGGTTSQAPGGSLQGTITIPGSGGQVFVGIAAQQGVPNSTSQAFFNGGTGGSPFGPGPVVNGSGGGGASRIRPGSGPVLAVAAGGGGQGAASTGGGGAGGAGGTSGLPGTSGTSGGGGGGGTTSLGGSGGGGPAPGFGGGSNSGGQGGGGGGTNGGNGGGGGGGGAFGGGGGGGTIDASLTGGGGGGGANFPPLGSQTIGTNVVTVTVNGTCPTIGPSDGHLIITYLTPKVTPSLTTTVIPKPPPANNRRVADQAVLSGGSMTNPPTGNITFYLYDQIDSQTCSGAIKEKSPPIPVNGNGVYQSPTFKIRGAAGTYAFKAVYSGDDNNNGVTSACEPFRVPGGDPPPDPWPCHKKKHCHKRKPFCCDWNICL